MKHKLSISVDSETVDLIHKLIAEGRFRNISHALEYAVNHMLLEAPK
ncbi:MAG: ribbon-helix-helix protein, CopG family [Candidatus Woesearchaeota archaeon]